MLFVQGKKTVIQERKVITILDHASDRRTISVNAPGHSIPLPCNVISDFDYMCDVHLGR